MSARAETNPGWADLLGPLLDGDPEPVRDVLDRALRSGRPRWAVHEELVIPCLRQIGELWQHGEITVPDEHLASHTMIGVLHDLRPAPVTGRDAPTAVVSCAPLENHTIPALLAGDLLADAGWRVWQLGASAPADELVGFVRHHDPRLLVLTSTLTRTVTGVADVARALDGATTTIACGAGLRHLAGPSAAGVDALGHRLADLPAFADRIVSTARAWTPGRVAAGEVTAPVRLTPEHVETALREAGTPLSISEIRERCGTTNSKVGVVLASLERARRVRFIGGRWQAVTRG